MMMVDNERHATSSANSTLTATSQHLTSLHYATDSVHYKKTYRHVVMFTVIDPGNSENWTMSAISKHMRRRGIRYWDIPCK